MTLKEYVFGRRIVLQSSYRKEKVSERIKQAVGSAFSPFHHGVAGGFYFGNLRLAWSIPWFGNGFQPVFSGRLIERGSKTELHATYGAPWFLLLFFAFWYGFLTIFTVIAFSTGLQDDLFADRIWLVVGTSAILWLFPLAIHLIFNANADKHFVAMLDLLEREAGFVVVSEGAAPTR